MQVGLVQNIAKGETCVHQRLAVCVWNDRDLDGRPVTFSILCPLGCSVYDQTLVVLGAAQDKGHDAFSTCFSQRLHLCLQFLDGQAAGSFPGGSNPGAI